MPPKVRSAFWWVFLATWIGATALGFYGVLTGVKITEGYMLVCWGVCVAGVARQVLALFFEEKNRREELSFESRNDPSLVKSLRQFIKGNRDVTIFSTTFSWLDESLLEILDSKKQSGYEVELFVPAMNDRATELAERGFDVREYAKNQRRPHLRLTMVNRTDSETQLWIGESGESSFVVTKFNKKRDAELVSSVSQLIDALTDHLDIIHAGDPA